MTDPRGIVEGTFPSVQSITSLINKSAEIHEQFDG